MKQNYPILISEDLAGFNAAKADFERKVFPFVEDIKNLYNELQLSEPFDDAVYLDIVSGYSKGLKAKIEKNISELPQIMGVNQQERLLVIRKNISRVMHQIAFRLDNLSISTDRPFYKGRCFRIDSIVNANTTPEISQEALDSALESFRIYIMDQSEHSAFKILNTFALQYGEFIAALKKLGYQNIGEGLYESFLSDFYMFDQHDNLQLNDRAMSFLCSLNKT